MHGPGLRPGAVPVPPLDKVCGTGWTRCAGRDRPAGRLVHCPGERRPAFCAGASDQEEPHVPPFPAACLRGGSGRRHPGRLRGARGLRRARRPGRTRQLRHRPHPALRQLAALHRHRRRGRVEAAHPGRLLAADRDLRHVHRGDQRQRRVLREDQPRADEPPGDRPGPDRHQRLDGGPLRPARLGPGDGPRQAAERRQVPRPTAAFSRLRRGSAAQRPLAVRDHRHRLQPQEARPRDPVHRRPVGRRPPAGSPCSPGSTSRSRC